MLTNILAAIGSGILMLMSAFGLSPSPQVSQIPPPQPTVAHYQTANPPSENSSDKPVSTTTSKEINNGTEVGADISTTSTQDSNANGMPPQSKWVSWQQLSGEKDSCRIFNPQNGEMFLEEIDNSNSNSIALVTQFPYSDLGTLVFQVTGNDNSLCNSQSQNQFAKDKNHVYWYAPGYFGEGHDTKDTNYAPPPYKTNVDDHSYYNAVIVSADPATFEVVSDRWAKDKDHAYGLVQGYNNIHNKLVTVTNVDPATFAALPGGWGKDKNHVYQVQDGKVTVINGVDGGTFTYLGKVNNSESGSLFEDKYQMYYDFQDNTGMGSTGDHWLLPINAINPAKFDAASFTDIGSGLVYKDKKHVYVISSDISSFTTLKQAIDVDSFEYLYINVYKDKNYVYELLNQQSPVSMRIIGEGLVDPSTLTFVGFGIKDGTYVFKDKDHTYQYAGGVFTVMPETSNTQ